MSYNDELEILGNQIAYEMLGASVDPPLVISSISEVANTGARAYETQQAKDRAEANAKAQLEKAIAADAEWATAEAVLEVAKKSGDAQRISAAQIPAQIAQQSASMAGQGLTPETVRKRVENAQKNASMAIASSDSTKFERAAAWQKVANAASLGSFGFGGGVPQGQSASLPGFLTRKYAGVPVWGWAIGVVIAGAGAYLLLRK